MAKGIAVRPQYKEIVRLYNSFLGGHQLWELWYDSMKMFAVSISNTVDSRFSEGREKQYKAISGKYTKKELEVFVQIFAEIVNQLEIEPAQDFLGDLYMTLELGSHWHGQFFTPYSVCAAMADLSVNFNTGDPSPFSVCDCACGGGALLIAAAMKLKNLLKDTPYNYQNYICCYAQDLSDVAAMMCYVQLSLQGLAAKIKVGDSLLDPLRTSDNGSDIWYTPLWFSDVWTIRRLFSAKFR